MKGCGIKASRKSLAIKKSECDVEKASVKSLRPVPAFHLNRQAPESQGTVCPDSLLCWWPKWPKASSLTATHWYQINQQWKFHWPIAYLYLFFKSSMKSYINKKLDMGYMMNISCIIQYHCHHHNRIKLNDTKPTLRIHMICDIWTHGLCLIYGMYDKNLHHG